MHRIHIPSFIHSSTGNCATSRIDPAKIIYYCKYTLKPDLIKQLKRVLSHHNPSNFNGHTTEEQNRQAHVCNNHVYISKNLINVEKTLNKEKLNKRVAALACCLEHLFFNMRLNPQDVIFKEGKNGLLVFDVSFFETPFSFCIKKIINEGRNRNVLLFWHEEEPSSNMKHSNLLPRKEILLFDDNASEAFCHVKFHPQATVYYSYSIVQSTCVSIGSSFGANFSSHKLETFSQSRCKKQNICNLCQISRT